MATVIFNTKLLAVLVVGCNEVPRRCLMAKNSDIKLDAFIYDHSFVMIGTSKFIKCHRNRKIGCPVFITYNGKPSSIRL